MAKHLVTAGGNGPPFPATVMDFEVEAHDDGAEDESLLDFAPPTEKREPWIRQPGEPSKAFHGFAHFRDMNGRSVRLAYIEHKKQCENIVVNPATPPKRWSHWSAQWGWIDRAAKWDAHIDAQHRAKVIEEQIEARARHARMAQATLSSLTVPVRTMMVAIQDQAVLDRLVNHAKAGSGATLQMLGMIARVAQVIPSMVNVERMALGLTTQSFEIDDRRETVDAIANRIVEDPEATDLAIRLLDRIAAKPKAFEGAEPPVIDLPPGPPTSEPDDE